MTDADTPTPVPRHLLAWFAAAPQLAVAGAAWLGSWSRETILLTLVAAGGTSALIALFSWLRKERTGAGAAG